MDCGPHIDLLCFSYQTLGFLWSVGDSGQCTTLPFPVEINNKEEFIYRKIYLFKKVVQ